VTHPLSARAALAAALSLAIVPASSQQPAAPQAPPVQAPPMVMQKRLARAPQGFLWRHYQAAVFVRPEAWSERTSLGPVARGGGTAFVYTATPASGDPRLADTVFTVEAIVGSRQLTGVDSPTVALLHLKPFVDAHTKEDVLLAERSTRGPFENTVFRYRDAPQGMKPMVVHKLVAASDRYDSVHVFTFESPEEHWKENWAAFGAPILRSAVVLAPNEARK